jgi:hypothetical protein
MCRSLRFQYVLHSIGNKMDIIKGLFPNRRHIQALRFRREPVVSRAVHFVFHELSSIIHMCVVFIHRQWAWNDHAHFDCYIWSISLLLNKCWYLIRIPCSFGSVRVWNLVSDIKGGTLTEGVWEQGAEEDIWTEEGWSDGRMEETA